jgi:hypothetical protein
MVFIERTTIYGESGDMICDGVKGAALHDIP